MAISITQQTEAGTVYSPEEIRAISSLAKQHALPLHMDGARFANALAHLGVSPAEMTWKAGVDILSFGGTKNGCIAAEALVFFDPEKAREAPFCASAPASSSRNRASSRRSSTPISATGSGSSWRVTPTPWPTACAQGIAATPRAREGWPTAGNEVFAVLPRTDADRLRKAGAVFHDWAPPHGSGVELAEDEIMVRLVASFATRPQDVDAFLAELAPETKTPRTSRGAVTQAEASASQGLRPPWRRSASTSALADRDLAGLHRLRDLADEVDVEQAVLEACAGDLDMVGKLEAALEGAGGDAAVEHLAAALLLLFLLLALDRQDVLLGLDVEVALAEAGDRQGHAVGVLAGALDVVGRVGLRLAVVTPCRAG